MEKPFNKEKTLKILKEKMDNLKKLGCIESKTNSSNEFGYIIENFLELEKNSLPVADFEGIEIKCRLTNTIYPIKLFSVTLDGDEPLGFYRIFEKYSVPSSTCYRSFNKTFYANKLTKIDKYTYGKLMIDYSNAKIYVLFYRNEIEDNIKYYWTFKTLYERLYIKLESMFLVNYSKCYINKKKYYLINGYNYYNLLGFGAFLNLLESGKVFINFSMQQATKDNKIKNHGPGFSIYYNDINYLFKKK